MKIEIMSKPSCHLCEDVKALLQKLQSDYSYTLEEINIETNPEHQELYGEKIPVIFINGKLIYYGRISEKALIRKLQETRR